MADGAGGNPLPGEPVLRAQLEAVYDRVDAGELSEEEGELERQTLRAQWEAALGASGIIMPDVEEVAARWGVSDEDLALAVRDLFTLRRAVPPGEARGRAVEAWARRHPALNVPSVTALEPDSTAFDVMVELVFHAEITQAVPAWPGGPAGVFPQPIWVPLAPRLTFKSSLPSPSSFAQLGPKLKVCGPPPPSAPNAHQSALNHSNQFEGPTMPETNRRWVEESKAWVSERQRQGRYRGRNGYEALRFLRRCGEWVPVFPSRVGVPDLRAILSHVGGTAPKTRRFYLSILSAFLSSLGNEVVRKSGIKNEYPNRAVRTPVLPGDLRDRLLDEAQGPERVILALLASARRPVEVTRALVSDLDLECSDPDMAVRGKGGHGDVTARVPLNQTVLRELRWYLPLRSQWAERAISDTGHLVCRWDEDRLVGVSVEYLRRALVRVCHGARTERWSLYSFRRGAATLLRDRKAEWEDIRDQLTHRSIGTTEGYVKSLQASKRAPSVARLLDAREPV